MVVALLAGSISRTGLHGASGAILLSTTVIPRCPFRRRSGPGMSWTRRRRLSRPTSRPDSETGLGRWSDQEIIRAIRDGIGRRWSASFAEHPANHYSVMTDQDATSIVSYLRSLRPIRRVLAPSARSQRQYESVQSPASPAQADSLLSPIQRGRYLVQLGECVGCHTPAKSDGNPVRELVFAGGRRFRLEKGYGVEVSSFDPTFSFARRRAPNLRPDESWRRRTSRPTLRGSPTTRKRSFHPNDPVG